MAFTADSAGFLTGEPMSTDRAVKILSGIRGDTRKILAAITKHGEAVVSERRRQVSRRTRGASSRAADDDGDSRMPGAPAPVRKAPARAAAEPVSAVARAAVAAARTTGDSLSERTATKAQRKTADALRDIAKQNAATAKRDAGGRFVAGERRAGASAGGGKSGEDGDRKSGRLSRMFSGMSGSSGPGIGAVEQIDPMLGAASEVRGMFSALSGIAKPILGAAVSPLSRMSSRQPDDGQASAGRPGVMRRILDVLRFSRRDAARQGKDTKAGLAEVASKVGMGGQGGGMLSGLLGMLGGPLGSLAAAVAPVAAVVGTVTAAFAGLLKRLPVLGGVIELISGWFKDSDIKDDKNLTEAQKDEARTRNAAETTGSVIGLGAGGALGSLFGPVGTVLGAGAGSWVGKKLGGLAGDALNTDTGKAVRGNIGNGVGRGFDAVKGLLSSAAEKTGTDPALLAKIVNYESGFNPDARPLRKDGSRISSAHGLGQMIDSTWVQMVRSHGEQFGIQGASKMSPSDALSLRGDAQLQANLTAALTAKNVATGRRIGGANDDANVYALHNLGDGDGSKFLRALKANPSAAVSSVLPPNVIANNPDLYAGGNLSVADAYSRMGSRMAKGQRFADAMSLAAPVAPKMLGAPSAAMPAIPKIPAAPSSEIMLPVPSINIESPSQPAPAPIITQDVRDRGIAHIVTGGIGQSAGMAHR
jgi:hypothetical protein